MPQHKEQRSETAREPGHHAAKKKQKKNHKVCQNKILWYFIKIQAHAGQLSKRPGKQ